MRRRLKEAVLRIVNTRDDEISGLPLIQRSHVPFLSMSSYIYTSIVLARQLLYRYGFFRQYRLPLYVVSVGNMTWGGNGKTPMTEYLSWEFMRAGIIPLILTRGYGGGDEAELLKRHFDGTSAKIGIGADRVGVAKSILQREYSCGIGVAILDDGMQHLRIMRDVEIVMVNALTLWGNERMIPRGCLREPLTSIQRAHVVVVHHANMVSEKRLEDIRNRIKEVCDGRKPAVVYSQMTPQWLMNKKNEVVSLDAVKDCHVVCVTGIGCPHSIILSLKQLGAYDVECMNYIDHHMFSQEDMMKIESKMCELKKTNSGRSVLLVTSEKDYARDVMIWRDHEVLILHSCFNLLDGVGDLDEFNKIIFHPTSYERTFL